MTDWLAGFETEPATYFTFAESGTVDDPYDPGGGTTIDYDWTSVVTVDVRFEPAGQGYRREETGEFVRRAPRVYAPASVATDEGIEEADALALDVGAEGPTHRIVKSHHHQLGAVDEGYVRQELEELDNG